MSADERFIAGEDRLAALLRALPPMVPPPSLEALVMAAARAEQAARQGRPTLAPSPPAAMPSRLRAYARQAGSPADEDIGDASLDFTAPPGLQASVMAEAARLQAAQAARRTATLDEIRRGDPARSVLGAQVGKETQAWLREHAQAGPQAAGKPAAARAARRWWPALGALAGAAGVAVLSLQIVMRQLDLRDGAIVLPAEAPMKDKKNGPPSTPAMQADAASPAAQARQQPPQATPPQPAQAGSATRQPSQAARAEAPPPAASAQARSTPAAETRSEAAPQALAERAGPAPGSPTPAPAASGYADAPPAAAPAAPAMPAPPAMAQMAPMPPRAPIAAPVPPAPIAPPAAAPAFQAPPLALRASPAPVSEAARASVPAARGQPAVSWTMSLREEPQLALERLLPETADTAQAAGKPLALRIAAASPASPEVRAWVERLWQAVPAPRRPPLPYAVQADSSLPPATLRIERQADGAP